MPSIVCVFVILSVAYYFVWAKKLELYLVFSLSVLVFLGFLSRILAFYFGDSSQLVQYLNVLLFLPVLVYGVLGLPRCLQNTKLVLIAPILVVLTVYGILGINNSVKAALFDFLSYAMFFLIPVFVVVYNLKVELLLSYTIRSVTIIMVLAIIYGLPQFFLGPNAMDSHWMVTSEFSIIGLPLPFLVKTFSFFASPGHLASFCLVYMIMVAAWLNKFEVRPRSALVKALIIVVLGLVLLVVTGVRSVLVLYVVFMLRVMFSSRVFAIVTVAGMLVVVQALAPSIGDSDLSRIVDRLSSFNEVLSGNDNSANTRLETLQKVYPEIEAWPIGHGLGSSGRYSIGDFTNIDNGYIDIMYELGVIFLPFIVLYLLVNVGFSFRYKNKRNTMLSDLSVMSGISLLALMLVGGILQLNIALYFSLFIGMNSSLDFWRRRSVT